MNISQLFIMRPIMTTLVMVGIVLFGIVGYRALAVSDLPNVDYPTIQVSAELPGASPETMSSAVATPLEKQFSTIAGLDSMNSTSSQGSTQITLQFNLTRNIDAAAQDVQTAIAAAARQLPPGMPSPPTLRKVNPADQPILYLVLTSSSLPLSKVNEFAETMLSQRISTTSGVAQVQVTGPQKYAVRVEIDPQKLASIGIGMDDVATAIQRGNSNLPVGTLYGPHQTFTVQANGQLTTADQFRSLVVVYRNGSPIKLGDLGNVIDSLENTRVGNWYGDNQSVTLAIQKQPGTNTIQVVDAIRNLLPQFRNQLPASVSLDILYDRSVSIRESVDDVQFTLILTVALVVMVIFLFLRNARATIIPSLALPASIVTTFAAMYLLGFSLNNLSLMALTLSVGFVVDDAIVMLENIVRRMEMGEDVLTASLKGSREIGFTIISMTISLVAVFIPVLFMGGILGRLFKEFAVTISVSILISGFVSLTLTPMLCNKFLHAFKHDDKHSKLFQISEKAFDMMLNAYRSSLNKVLQYRNEWLIVSLILAAITAYLFYIIPKGFIPSDDQGQIVGYTEGAQGISFEDMQKHQQELVELIRQDANVATVSSTVGQSEASPASNTGTLLILLKPTKERKKDVEEIIEELRPKLANVAGIQIFLQNPPSISIGGQVTKSLYQITLQGPTAEELYQSATDLQNKMSELPELQDVTSDLQINNPQLNIDIDRDKASAVGVSAQQIEDTLNSAYGTRQISTIYTASNEYQVIMEVRPDLQNDVNDVSQLYIHASAGTAGNRLVPLSSIARLSRSVGPLLINHLGQLPSVTISFNLKPGVSLNNATAAVEQLAQSTLPKTINLSFQGTAQVFASSLSGLGWLLLLAVLVIYLVLGMLYESFIHPLTILSGLPSAGLGALLTLLLFNRQLDVYAFVGLIMLVGIVKKNAIMMIDFALEAQRDGKPAHDAIYEACLVRFRPIMMTTMAALMGSLPIALGIGAGAESRQSLGLAVVGGLMVSQVLTLFLTPILFIFFEDLRARLFHRSEPSEAGDMNIDHGREHVTSSAD